MQTGLIYTETALRVCRNQARKRRKENGTAGNGMEDSKERRGDKGEQTHAKPPPTAPGDLGSGDRGPPPPPEEEGSAADSSRGQLKIQLVIQRIQDARGGECIVLWDLGAQVSLVTHEYARGPDSKDDLPRYELQE
jgi:hypothetical protein